MPTAKSAVTYKRSQNDKFQTIKKKNLAAWYMFVQNNERDTNMVYMQYQTTTIGLQAPDMRQAHTKWGGFKLVLKLWRVTILYTLAFTGSKLLAMNKRGYTSTVLLI